MSAVSVDGLKTFMQTNCSVLANNEIVNWIDAFTSEEDREYACRLLIETATLSTWETYNFQENKSNIEFHIDAADNLDNVIKIIQEERYKKLGLDYPAKYADLIDQVGWTEDEARYYFRIWKKAYQSPLCFEEKLNDYMKPENCIFSARRAHYVIYYKMVDDFLKEVKGCEIADWQTKTESNQAINLFNNVKGDLIIIQASDFLPILWDFTFDGDSQTQETQAATFWSYVNGEKKNDNFLTKENGEAILKKSLPILLVSYAVLVLQSHGHRLTGYNLAREYASANNPFVQLQVIERLKHLEWHKCVVGNEMIKEQAIKLYDDAGYYANQHIDQINFEQFKQDWDAYLASQQRIYAEREIDNIISIFDGAQDIGQYMAEQYKKIYLSTENGILEAKAGIEKRIKDAAALMVQNWQVIKAEKEKVVKVDVDFQRDITKDKNIRSLIKEWLGRDFPKHQEEDVQKKYDEYSQLPQDQAIQKINVDAAKSEAAWKELYDEWINIFKTKIIVDMPPGLFKYNNDENNDENQEAIDKHNKSIDDSIDNGLDGKYIALKNENKGDADAALKQLREEIENELPKLKQLSIQKNDLIKTCRPFGYFVLVVKKHFNFKKVVSEYVEKVYPKTMELIKYQPGYYLLNEKKIDLLDDPECNYDGVIKMLDEELAKFTARKEKWSKDPNIQALVKRYPGIATWEDIAGHCKKDKEIKLYLQIKQSYLQSRGNPDPESTVFVFIFNNDFHHKFVEEDISRWYKKTFDSSNLPEEIELPEEIASTTNQYYQDITDPLDLKNYIEVETVFRDYKKFDKTARKCKTFEEYIIKKGDPSRYSSEKSCFLANIKKFTEYFLQKIEGWKQEDQGLKSELWTDKNNKTWDITKAIGLWDSIFEDQQLGDPQNALAFFHERGISVQEGIKYLVETASLQNKTKEINGEFLKAMESWGPPELMQKVIIDNYTDFANKLGGAQQAMTFLKKLVNPAKEYLIYHNDLKLQTFMDKVKTSGDDYYVGEAILAQIKQENLKANGEVNDFKRDNDLVLEQCLGIYNNIAPKQKWDKIKEYPVLDIYRKYNGDTQKMKIELNCRLYNLYANSIDYKGGAKPLVEAEVDQYANASNGLEKIVEKIQILTSGHMNQKAWKEDSDCLAFQEFLKTIGMYTTQQEINKIDNQFAFLGEDDRYTAMTNFLNKKYYKWSGGKQYTYPSGMTNKSEKFNALLTDTIRLRKSYKSKKGNQDLYGMWQALKDHIPEKDFGKFAESYPNDDDAIRYLQRVNLELQFRQLFRQQSIDYPAEIKTDAQKIDYLNEYLSGYQQVDLAYLGTNEFWKPWTDYLATGRSQWKSVYEFVSHFQHKRANIEPFLKCELKKEEYLRNFDKEFEGTNYTVQEQLRLMEKRLDDLKDYKNDDKLGKELEKWNNHNTTKYKLSQMVLDESKDKEDWKVFLEYHNLVNQISKLSKNFSAQGIPETPEGIHQLHEQLKKEQTNNQNWDSQYFKDLLKSYKHYYGSTVDVDKLKDKFHDFRDASMNLEVKIKVKQLEKRYGFTNEELNKLVDDKDDEKTLQRLENERSICSQELDKLINDSLAMSYLNAWQDKSKMPDGMTELFKKHGHRYDSVMFYLVYYDYHDKIEKTSEQEMKARYNNDLARGIGDMDDKLNTYYNRQELFEEEDSKSNFMISKKYTYDESMKEFPELRSNDIRKDLENAMYLLGNFDEKAKYQKILAEIGEEDLTVDAYDNSKSREKRQYLKKKIAEYERYKEILTTGEIDGYFKAYSLNNPYEKVTSWADRYKWAMKLFQKIDKNQIEKKLKLDNGIKLFEEKYNVLWEDQEESKKNEDEQIKYLEKVLRNEDKYNGVGDLDSAIEEYNNAFRPKKIKRQYIVNKFGDDVSEAIIWLLREARLKKVKDILGNRFKEDDFPDTLEGLEKLKSVIDYEEGKVNNINNNDDLKDDLEKFNKYFSGEPPRDLIWVRDEFQNDPSRARYGLKCYIIIEQLNKFYREDKYTRDDIKNKILKSSDYGEKIYQELNKLRDYLENETTEMEDLSTEDDIQDALAYWNQQHGTEYNFYDCLRELGQYKDNKNKYPKAKKAIAELLIFYRNSLFPKNQKTKEIIFSTKLDPLIDEMLRDITKAKSNERASSQDDIKNKMKNLNLDYETQETLLRKYDKPEDLNLHLEILELKEKYDQINDTDKMPEIDDINNYTFKEYSGKDLKKYLSEVVKYDWSTIKKELEEMEKRTKDNLDVEKYGTVDGLKSAKGNAFEARAFLLCEELRLDFNELSGKNYSMNTLLKRWNFDLAALRQYLDYNVVKMKFRKSKRKEPELIKDYDAFLADPKHTETIQRWREWVEKFEDKLDKETKEKAIMANNITKEKLQEYASSQKDIEIIMKTLDNIKEFNEKFGKKYDQNNLSELCSEEGNWTTAYFNVRVLPLLQDYNYIANKRSEPGLTTEKIITEFGLSGKKNFTVEKIDEILPELKKKVIESRDLFLDPHFKEYNEISGEAITKLDEVTKIYPNVDDAERFLRIEKFCKPIRKMIKEMKTMKYEIPTTLNLDEKKFEYELVKSTNNNVDVLEQNLQQQYVQFQELLKKFQEKDAEDKKQKNVLNPKINDINRMRRKLGMSEITIDKYKNMEFENAKQALDDEKRDLEEKQREKDNQKSNSVGGGFNSGSSFGGTVGQPLRFSALNAQRQTNPLTPSTNSTTNPTTFSRPGMEVNKSGIGDLTRANAPLRLTGFNRDTPKPASDSLFSLKSKFDSGSDDDDNPLKPKVNDFTKPLVPSNKFAPPVSLRRWILDKQRAQRLKKDSYPATSPKPSPGPSSLFTGKAEEPEEKWPEDDDDNDEDLPVIKPITSPVMLVKDNNPIEKIASITDKLEEYQEPTLTTIKTPKMPQTGNLLPIPIDQKTKIRTSSGIVELPTRARKDAPLYAVRMPEVIPQMPVVRPVESKVFLAGPSLDDDYQMPRAPPPRRQIIRRETFTPNRNTSKQEVDRKLMEIRQRNKMKNAPLRIQRQQGRAMPVSRPAYQPPIQTNNIPISILENPQLAALMKV